MGAPQKAVAWIKPEEYLALEEQATTTEAFDRGEKFDVYKQIPTLEEYVLVSLRDRRVEVFRRGLGWSCEESIGAPVALDSLGLVLKPDEIFDQLA